MTVNAMSGLPSVASVLPPLLERIRMGWLAKKIKNSLMSKLERDVRAKTGGSTLSSRFDNAVNIEGIAACSPLTVDAAFASQDLQVITTVLKRIHKASVANAVTTTPLVRSGAGAASISRHVASIRTESGVLRKKESTAELMLRDTRAAMIAELYRHARSLEDVAATAGDRAATADGPSNTTETALNISHRYLATPCEVEDLFSDMEAGADPNIAAAGGVAAGVSSGPVQYSLAIKTSISSGNITRVLSNTPSDEASHSIAATAAIDDVPFTTQVPRDPSDPPRASVTMLPRSPHSDGIASESPAAVCLREVDAGGTDALVPLASQDRLDDAIMPSQSQASLAADDAGGIETTHPVHDLTAQFSRDVLEPGGHGGATVVAADDASASMERAQDVDSVAICFTAAIVKESDGVNPSLIDATSASTLHYDVAPSMPPPSRSNICGIAEYRASEGDFIETASSASSVQGIETFALEFPATTDVDRSMTDMPHVSTVHFAAVSSTPTGVAPSMPTSATIGIAIALPESPDGDHDGRVDTASSAGDTSSVGGADVLRDTDLILATASTETTHIDARGAALPDVPHYAPPDSDSPHDLIDDATLFAANALDCPPDVAPHYSKPVSGSSSGSSHVFRSSSY